jgi:acetate kinase
MSEILVLNAGSSTLKFSLFAAAQIDSGLELICRGSIEGIGSETGRFHARDKNSNAIENKTLRGLRGPVLRHEGALERLGVWLEERGLGGTLSAVGHRVAHGGEHFAGPVQINEAVLEQLEDLVPLAPLHQPHNLAAVKAVAMMRHELPQVACFDTAFHRTQPAVAQAFALPRELSAVGIRRYGFHGLSYEYIASVLPAIAGEETARGRVVVAHLGSGASMCGLHKGLSIASTMGFTALEGLPMGTRTGAIDPGVLLYLMHERGMDYDGLTELLYKRSGLLGVSGISNDMRDLLASEHPHAKEAVHLFVYRIGRELGSLAAALGGLDALVFTAGIGERSPTIRASVCEDAEWLGIRLDYEANEAAGPRISADGSAVSVWAIPTNEELMIARHTQALLSL